MSDVRFYCESCDERVPVDIEHLRKDVLNGDVAWGDIICAMCFFVIATVSAEEEGIYDFVKVGEHAASHDPEMVEV